MSDAQPVGSARKKKPRSTRTFTPGVNLANADEDAQYALDRSVAALPAVGQVVARVELPKQVVASVEDPAADHWLATDVLSGPADPAKATADQVEDPANAEPAMVPSSAAPEAAAEEPAAEESDDPADAEPTLVSPSAVPEPAPSAQPLSAKQGGTRQSSGRKPRIESTWAVDAVRASYVDAKVEPRDWSTTNLRVTDEIYKRLMRRITTDSRVHRSNRALGQSHYIDAALRAMPPTTSERIEMAQRYLRARVGAPGDGRNLTPRLSSHARSITDEIPAALAEVEYGRKSVFIASAAIEVLLDALDLYGDFPALRP
jgi:hypothetical protein